MNAIRLLLPILGEGADNLLHLLHVDPRRRPLLSTFTGAGLVHIGHMRLGGLYEANEVGVVPLQLALYEELHLVPKQVLEAGRGAAGQVPLVKHSEHEIVVVHQEDEAALSTLELHGHRRQQRADLLHHRLQRMLQRVREAASAGAASAAGGCIGRSAQGVEARRQLRIPACHEVWVRIGRLLQILLASLAERGDVGVEHASQAWP
mmetsp:Transcript_73585/g.157769  ORF Transcript_73585/g.157769 Transcript_73585/m.157769 type:complete len:206 (-) Transcript_73585:1451-2068(-)